MKATITRKELEEAPSIYLLYIEKGIPIGNQRYDWEMTAYPEKFVYEWKEVEDIKESGGRTGCSVTEERQAEGGE